MNIPKRTSDRCRWGLYPILDRAISGQSHVESVRQVIAGGAKVVQLRDKTASFEELMETGAIIRKMTREAGVDFIVNDNPYLARELDADGVHIGQSDFPPDIVREVIGPDRILGLSTHSKQQALAATTFPIDYIGVGPIYPTTSKVSEYVPVGLSLVRWVRQNIHLPIVAIGGITEETIPDVVAAGADNAAVIRELMSAADIQMHARHLRQMIDRIAAE